MKIAVIMGSKSDFPIVKKAVDCLESFGVEHSVRVLSAHRTPVEAAEFAKNAKSNGFGALIAAAGKAAHLAGVLAAYTTLPVIAVPISSPGLGGMDALLSSVQMPSGIPVATVAIDGAENAALLAVQILALCDPGLAAKLEQKKASLREAALEADRTLS